MGTKAQVLSSTETPEPHRASTSSSVKWVPCWPAHTQGRGEGGLKSDMEGSLSWDHSDTRPLAICIEGADSNEQGADPGLLQASQHCWGGPSSWPQSKMELDEGSPGLAGGAGLRVGLVSPGVGASEDVGTTGRHPVCCLTKCCSQGLAWG